MISETVLHAWELETQVLKENIMIHLFSNRWISVSGESYLSIFTYAWNVCYILEKKMS